MANYKNIILGALVVVIIGLVGFLFLSNGEKNFYEAALPIEESNTQVKDSNVDTHPKDWVEYKNDQLGFSFWYPSSYGEVNMQTKDLGYVTGDAGRILVKSFQGYFTDEMGPSFWGGVNCVDCEPYNFVTKKMVDEVTKKQPIFNTNSGIPVYELVKPCGKENCPELDRFNDGQYLIKLNNDYNGVVFSLEATDEVLQILKTFELK